jgi:O-antigen ligase
LWFLVAMAAVAISTVATGSRAPTLLLAVVLATHLIASAGGRVRRSGVGRSLLGIGLMLALVRFVGSDVTEALAFRMRSTEENLVRRFVEPFVEPMRIFSETGFVGYGIGATHQAAANLVPKVPPYSWLDGFEIEAETSRVMLELGGLGFAAVFALRIALIVFAYRAIRRASTLFHRSIAVSAFLMMFVQLIGAVVFNVTANFYYFFCAGLVVLVHERARAAGREARAAAAEARASDRAAGARGWVDPPLPSPR